MRAPDQWNGLLTDLSRLETIVSVTPGARPRGRHPPSPAPREPRFPQGQAVRAAGEAATAPRTTGRSRAHRLCVTHSTDRRQYVMYRKGRRWAAVALVAGLAVAAAGCSSTGGKKSEQNSNAGVAGGKANTPKITIAM